MSGDEDRLEEVASSLFEKRDELNGQAERWKRERDRLNESVKDFQGKALGEKEERDKINEKVAEIKKRVEGLRVDLAEKRGSAEGLDEELEEGRRRLRSRRRLEEELREIEWELSTTPTLEIKDREEELTERARELRLELEEHTKLDAKDDRYLHSLADSKAVEVGIREGLDEMRALHEVSQEHHERMLTFYRKADEERKRSDEAHKRFVECLNEIKEVNGELDTVMAELRKQRKELKDTDRRMAMRRSTYLQEKRKELAAEARRKLEAGEKLTLEEMKLVYGEY
ncbi:hypothetical protein E3J39_01605 [Candidatus Bathyarchaeota archaeon]|nr:MAG: hypothetical protein E3J39_01605 [Candidatus Bathyarchaeota archaeon]